MAAENLLWQDNEFRKSYLATNDVKVPDYSKWFDDALQHRRLSVSANNSFKIGLNIEKNQVDLMRRGTGAGKPIAKANVEKFVGSSILITFKELAQTESKPTHQTENSPNSPFKRFRVFRKRISVLRKVYSGRFDASFRDKFSDSIVDSQCFYSLACEHLPVPEVNVSEDGDTVLEWYLGDKEIIVDFEGDGQYGYAYLVDNKFKAGKAIGTVDDAQIPEDLLQYVK